MHICQTNINNNSEQLCFLSVIISGAVTMITQSDITNMRAGAKILHPYLSYTGAGAMILHSDLSYMGFNSSDEDVQWVNSHAMGELPYNVRVARIAK